jgi:uncharacterized glyoxalase superfamily protein PhnB
MAKAASPIPHGMHALTPHISVNGAAKAIEWYKKAFGAQEIARHAMPDGRLMHAALRIGDSVLMLNDSFQDMGAPAAPNAESNLPFNINLYVPDADEVYNRATSAGAKVRMPLADQFWGDRYGMITDPFGYNWAIATRKEDLTPQELGERAAKMFSGAGKKG